VDWVYSDTVKEHFIRPKNILLDEKEFKEDGKGYVGNPKCGDMMLLVIKVDKTNNTITECKWKTYGCASAVASTSMLSEMVKGMSLDDAYNIKPNDIMDKLGGLPDNKIHCSVLGDKALRDAIDNYYFRTDQKDKIKKKKSIEICHCLSVTDAEIEEEVLEGVKDFETLQERTKLGTSCGKCIPQAKELLNHYVRKYYGED